MHMKAYKDNELFVVAPEATISAVVSKTTIEIEGLPGVHDFAEVVKTYIAMQECISILNETS